MSFSRPSVAPATARSFFTPPSVTSTGGAAAWFAAQRTAATPDEQPSDWSDGAGRGDGAERRGGRFGAVFIEPTDLLGLDDLVLGTDDVVAEHPVSVDGHVLERSPVAA